MRIMQYDETELTEFANMTKEALVIQFMNDGVIDASKFDCETLCGSYVVIPVRKGIFGKIYDILHGFKDDKLYISVLRSTVPKLT